VLEAGFSKNQLKNKDPRKQINLILVTNVPIKPHKFSGLLRNSSHGWVVRNAINPNPGLKLTNLNSLSKRMELYGDNDTEEPRVFVYILKYQIHR